MNARIVRRFVYAVLSLTLTLGSTCLEAQNTKEDPIPQQDNSEIQRSLSGAGYTLRVTTREVVIEVVARDDKGRPVNDLTESDFQIFEAGHQSADAAKPISGFRTVDPNVESPNNDRGNIVLPLGGRCEIRTTVHYELAFHPARWTSGYHSVLVTASRQRIKLSYRKQFYVGVENIPAGAPSHDSRSGTAVLENAACYHSGVPSSLFLSAELLSDFDESKVRYAVDLLPGSLAQAGIEENTHRVQLQYGVCTFTRAGRILDFWTFSADRLLNDAEIRSTLVHGWSESIEVSRHERPALVRFVVLEPRSGNLGVIDLSPDGQATTADTAELGVRNPIHNLLHSDQTPPSKAISVLGSPVPRAGALCGDVYELPTNTTLLPSNFQVLNAVGAVYAKRLNVPEQVLGQGVPGSTPRSEWFGIDYYGQFWITTPGKYLFVLNADDGADLYIDDHLLIRNDGIHPPQTIKASVELVAGRHAIHLPYFQGPTYVNLILQVQPPDQELRIFDIRDFTNPAQSSVIR